MIASARDCLTPLADDDVDDRVLPAFSSGQWAGTVPPTWAARGQRRFPVHVRRRHHGASGRPGGGRRQHPSGGWRCADGRRDAGSGRGAASRSCARALGLRSDEIAVLAGPLYGWYGDDFTGATDTLATSRPSAG